MHNEILNLIRVGLLGVLVFVGAAVGVTTEPSSYQEPMETTCLETTVETTQDATDAITTEAPTEPSAPPETEPPTETTTPETEPPVVTEPPTEAIVVPIETKPPYTQEELDLLALVIYQEAGSDAVSDETRLMVGSVVMNRVASPYYPDTLYEVATQEAQYGMLFWTGPVWPERASDPDEAHAVDRAYTIAERILNGERALPDDVIYQAEFPQGTEVVAYQGGMYFCR